jgi:hypothetical protein
VPGRAEAGEAAADDEEAFHFKGGGPPQAAPLQSSVADERELLNAGEGGRFFMNREADRL